MVQAYSIPKATRPPNPSEVYTSPGPGDYKGELKGHKEEPPKWSFGSTDTFFSHSVTSLFFTYRQSTRQFARKIEGIARPWLVQIEREL